MKTPQDDSTKRIDFVHFAIPNLALGEIDTSYVLNDSDAGVELGFPLVIMVKDRDEAKNLSMDNRSIPIAVKEEDHVDIFLSGIERSVPLNKRYLVRVEDGMDIAKTLRVEPKALPFIGKERIDELEILIKQLRIVMFLTNSRNLDDLIKAPVYTE